MSQQPQGQKVLVVDDEAGIRDLLVDVLGMSGYAVTATEDGLRAFNTLKNEKFDIVIADVNMPQLDGYGLIERMRESGDMTPVILLTARGENKDVSMGLSLGADDYVAKPFSFDVLVQRIAAVLRRTQGTQAADRIISAGPLTMNHDLHQVTIFEEPVDLSPTEYNLLEYLMERAGRVIEKDVLLSAIWGIEFETNTTVVDTYISYLRKKLHKDGFEGIKTVRGVGFQLVVAK
jgi:two-component system OmpR family response regulator